MVFGANVAIHDHVFMMVRHRSTRVLECTCTLFGTGRQVEGCWYAVGRERLKVGGIRLDVLQYSTCNTDMRTSIATCI